MPSDIVELQRWPGKAMLLKSTAKTRTSGKQTQWVLFWKVFLHPGLSLWWVGNFPRPTPSTEIYQTNSEGLEAKALFTAELSLQASRHNRLTSIYNSVQFTDNTEIQSLTSDKETPEGDKATLSLPSARKQPAKLNCYLVSQG